MQLLHGWVLKWCWEMLWNLLWHYCGREMGFGIANLKACQNNIISVLTPNKHTLFPKTSSAEKLHAVSFTKILVLFLVPLHPWLSKQRFVYPWSGQPEEHRHWLTMPANEALQSAPFPSFSALFETTSTCVHYSSPQSFSSISWREMDKSKPTAVFCFHYLFKPADILPNLSIFGLFMEKTLFIFQQSVMKQTYCFMTICHSTYWKTSMSGRLNSNHKGYCAGLLVKKSQL